jgi:O-antigen ligase
MGFPLLEAIGRLDLASLAVLAVAGMLVLYLSLSRQFHALMFLLALSASLVGSMMPVVDSIASLVRWVSILALFISGLLLCRIELSLGLLLFWGYAFLGFVFLLRAVSSSWQLQKSSLLIIVAVAMPAAFSASASLRKYKATLVSISMAATTYSLVNFLPLTAYLSNPVRYPGYAKGAAAFSIFLGGLLPFTLWGLWKAEARMIRVACGLGLLFGTVSLILSGQRAGIVIGFVGILPLLLMATTSKEKGVGRFILILILVLGLIYLFLEQSSAARRGFLASRYSLDYGLSRRDWVWQQALSEIAKDPLLGRGIGAVEAASSYGFHNAYLEIWFNAGLLGLALFVASQSYFLYRTIWLYRVANDPEIKSILALAVGYMIGFIALSIVESKGAAASNINLILYLFLAVLVSNNSLLDSSGSQAAEDDSQ